MKWQKAVRVYKKVEYFVDIPTESVDEALSIAADMDLDSEGAQKLFDIILIDPPPIQLLIPKE